MYNKDTEDGITYRYKYDFNGNLAKIIDTNAGTKTLYKYDLQGRMTGYVEMDIASNESLITDKYLYDDEGKLVEVFCIARPYN